MLMLVVSLPVLLRSSAAHAAHRGQSRSYKPPLHQSQAMHQGDQPLADWNGALQQM